RRVMVGFAVAAPFLRPEGMVASVLLTVALALYGAPGDTPIRRGAFSAGALGGIVGVPLLPVVRAGPRGASTPGVYGLPANPYYRDFGVLAAAVRENVRIFVVTLLDGREWSAVYVPSGARGIALAGLLSIPLAGFLRGRRFRAAVVLALALGMLLPC